MLFACERERERENNSLAVINTWFDESMTSCKCECFCLCTPICDSGNIFAQVSSFPKLRIQVSKTEK